MFLAATLVGWIGGDFVYKKVAAKNISSSSSDNGADSIPSVYRAIFKLQQSNKNFSEFYQWDGGENQLA